MTSEYEITVTLLVSEDLLADVVGQRLNDPHCVCLRVHPTAAVPAVNPPIGSVHVEIEPA